MNTDGKFRLGRCDNGSHITVRSTLSYKNDISEYEVFEDTGRGQVMLMHSLLRYGVHVRRDWAAWRKRWW